MKLILSVLLPKSRLILWQSSSDRKHHFLTIASAQGSQQEMSAEASNPGPVDEPRPVADSGREEDNSGSESDDPDAYKPPAPAEAEREEEQEQEDDAEGETDAEIEEVVPMARRQLRARREQPPLPRSAVLARAVAAGQVAGPAVAPARAPASGPAPAPAGPRPMPKTTGQIRKPRIRRAKPGSTSRFAAPLKPSVYCIESNEPPAKALREIRRLQKSTELLIPRASFQRLVKEICDEICPGLRFQSAAMGAIQEMAEAVITREFERR